MGTADLGDAGSGLEVGLFVSSPPDREVHRSAGGVEVGEKITFGRATFDDVTVQPTSAATVGGWEGSEVGGSDKFQASGVPAGSVVQSGGVFTVTGSGGIGSAEAPDDGVQASLFGTVFGLMALAAVSVLFITSEYKRHLIRTTFTASPRRRHVLAAKAIVLACTTFVIGLVTSMTAYVVARPVLESHGFGPPAYSPSSLGQANVWRALIGNAILLTAFAMLGLALGAICRRSSGAIASIFIVGVLPLFASAVAPTAATWLLWLTPAGGFAVQRAKPPTNELAEPWSQLNPWLGLTIACAYAAAALVVAAWLIERRDA